MLPKDTPVIILCGGEGTRIADVSRDAVPKPLIRIGDKPILWHIMKIYSHFGYRNFILALGHLGWEIKSYFLNHRLMDCDFELVTRGNDVEINVHSRPESNDWRITFAETGAKTQTGRRIALCRKYVTTDHFMVTYGDGVADIDIDALARFAIEKDRIGTVTAVKPSSRFGDIEVNAGGDVTAFAEKQDAGGGTINGGFFVFKREFMDIAERHGDVMLERQPMDDLVAQGELAAFHHGGFWEPMDTMREFKQLNDMWNNGTAKWKMW
ncbi:MAG: sugar phosphate nucleotidyltransferase [Allosphingosinicella sp.]|uniref:sugar phosphate nucleotidyltransferase n=1 Tax=Allosphingosinicella sp. TaxID=2823234 RepID=UPI0039358874